MSTARYNFVKLLAFDDVTEGYGGRLVAKAADFRGEGSGLWREDIVLVVIYVTAESLTISGSHEEEMGSARGN